MITDRHHHTYGLLIKLSLEGLHMTFCVSLHLMHLVVSVLQLSLLLLHHLQQRVEAFLYSTLTVFFIKIGSICSVHFVETPSGQMIEIVASAEDQNAVCVAP
jgi:hypothetical protein